MEISLQSGLFALNPRRIIYIENFREPTPEAKELGHDPYGRLSPNAYDKALKECESNKEEYDYLKNYKNVIVIHLTDGETIRFTTENDSYYENIKKELSSIVGG
jgi:hypothetical protein